MCKAITIVTVLQKTVTSINLRNKQSVHHLWNLKSTRYIINHPIRDLDLPNLLPWQQTNKVEKRQGQMQPQQGNKKCIVTGNNVFTIPFIQW